LEQDEINDLRFGSADTRLAPPPPPKDEFPGGTGAWAGFSSTGELHAESFFFDTFFCACAVVDRPQEHFHRFKDGFDKKDDPAFLPKRCVVRGRGAPLQSETGAGGAKRNPRYRSLERACGFAGLGGGGARARDAPSPPSMDGCAVCHAACCGSALVVDGRRWSVGRYRRYGATAHGADEHLDLGELKVSTNNQQPHNNNK
jgi:hypothetical protein